jgi:hypothetical protein
MFGTHLVRYLKFVVDENDGCHVWFDKTKEKKGSLSLGKEGPIASATRTITGENIKEIIGINSKSLI